MNFKMGYKSISYHLIPGEELSKSFYFLKFMYELFFTKIQLLDFGPGPENEEIFKNQREIPFIRNGLSVI